MLPIQLLGLCPPARPLMSGALSISAAVLIYGLLSHRTYDSLCLLLAGDFP